MKTVTLLVGFALLGLAATFAQQPKSSSPPLQHDCDAHFDSVDRRGDQGMGFSHKMTRHHFRLQPDGGTIEVEADSAADSDSREAIRKHMTMIAGSFGKGNFALPMFIHDTVPPGLETMKKMRDQIQYSAEATGRGAQVRIATKNSEAIKAIHDFLRFQIIEHRTRDSTDAKQ